MAAAAAEEEEGRHRACLQCTQHCHQNHGNGILFSRNSSFYALFNDIVPLCLRIPPSFLGDNIASFGFTIALDKHLRLEVQLQGPSGQLWSVIAQGWTSQELAFTEGWETFATDHGLKVGDVLIFKLLSRGSFSVSIYGMDGCEKTDALMVKNSGSILAHGSNKRSAEEKLLDINTEPKRRKVTIPFIIDLDDDDDVILLRTPEVGNAKHSAAKVDVIDLSGFEPSNANEITGVEQIRLLSHSSTEFGSRQHKSPTCRPGSEQVTDCIIDDTKCNLDLLELPRTPSNVDESSLHLDALGRTSGNSTLVRTNLNANNLNTNLEGGANNHNDIVKQPDSKCRGQHVDLSEEEAGKGSYKQKILEHVEKFSQCLPQVVNIDPHSQKAKLDDGLFHTDEDYQHAKLEALLAKDYITEAFVSKRRPVSAEEREKALLAARHFKSSQPHTRKLMKESHVYRGFWLSFPAEFSYQYLTVGIQEATLLDSSGKAWSAKWLGNRSGLSGGWRKFSLDHGLEEGDVCVFELIDRKKLVLQVHIFRVVELKNGLPGREHYLRKPQSRPLEKIALNCKKTAGPTKKMRGAIALKKAGYVHLCTSSKQYKGVSETNKKSEKQEMATVNADVECAEKRNARDKRGTESVNTYIGEQLQSSKELGQVDLVDVQDKMNEDVMCREVSVDAESKCLMSNEDRVLHRSMDGGGKDRVLDPCSAKRMMMISCSDVERGLHMQTDGGAAAADDASSLHTPPKTRELKPGNLEKRHSGKSVKRQLITPPYKGQNASALPKLTSADVSDANAGKVYYTVERLYNRRKGNTEEEFLVELDVEGLVSFPSSSCRELQRDGSCWWVPLSHFTKDKVSCHL